MNSYAMYSCGLLHIDEQRLDNQLEPIYSCSVLIQDLAWKTCWERWTIGTNGKRGSRRSVLAARHDDNIYHYILVYHASFWDLNWKLLQLEIVGVPFGLGQLLTHKICISHLVGTPNIWLKFRSQNVTWYANICSTFFFFFFFVVVFCTELYIM